MGSYQAAAAQANARHLWTKTQSGDTIKEAVAEWYIDDGQIVIRPLLLHPWLEAYDRAIGMYGATRGTLALGTAKSTCRLHCPPALLHTIQGWDTALVK